MSQSSFVWYLQDLQDEIWSLFTYHRSELMWYILRMIGMGITVFWVTDMWNRGWDQGITWQLFNSILDGLPRETADPIVVPFFFVAGIILVFLFDQYKRLQGAILIVGIFTTAYMMSYFGRVDIEWQAPTIAIAAIAGGVGLYLGHYLGEQDDAGLNRYDNTFTLLWLIVLVVCVWGFFEAHVDYVSPYIWGEGWVGTELETFTVKSTVPLTNESTTLSVAILIGVLDVIAIAVLLWVLRGFTKYEMDKNAIIIGPDRAGKTWLIGGAAYSLINEGAKGTRAINPIPEFDDGQNELKKLVDAFDNENFDHSALGGTKRLKQFKLRYNYGLIAKREVTVQSFDYPGEHISNATFQGTDKAREQFNNVFNDVDAEYNNTGFGDLKRKQPPDVTKDMYIGAIISAAVAKADTVGLVIPIDDFVEGLTDDELPSYMKSDDLDISRNIDRSTYLKIYQQTIENYGDTRDIFFIPTMSDTLLKKFDGDLENKAGWPDFRLLVWKYVSLQHSTGTPFHCVPIEMGEYHPNTDKPGPVHPVYLQAFPERDKAWTQNGNLIPYLNWQDQRYPLRGLRELLKALGR